MSHKKMLQIVTTRSNKLKKMHKFAYFALLFATLSACVAPQQPVDNSQQKLQTPQIEPHKGRLSLETAIARSLKYNLQPVKQQVVDKFIGKDARQNAFANFRKLREGQSISLAVSQKELDFAIFYATVNTIDNSQQIDDIFNRITAQNIVLGTIKAHKNALFDHKKIFEVNRKLRQNKKQLEALIKKSSENNLAYQKKLEANIDKLNAVQQTMERQLNDFRQLTRIETQKIELDGRRFFDNIALPLSSSSSYISSAFQNRSELKNYPSFSLDMISQKFSDLYPDDLSYLDKLSARGDVQASVLLQTALDYQKAATRQKTKLLNKLSEELHKALYLQIETAYRLAMRTSADYERQNINLQKLKQTVHGLEKISRPTEEQNIALLDAKTNFLENEILADQILSEKALTISSLRFYDGQINITPALLSASIGDIAKYFSEQLQKNPTLTEKEKLSTPDIEKISETKSGWAHNENWLEELMHENPMPATPKLMSKAPLSGDYDRKTVMQLGAFLDEDTAVREWKRLSADFPELNKYTPVYEKTTVAGIPLFRVLIQSSQGGFKQLCIKLRQSGKECFLRD